MQEKAVSAAAQAGPLTKRPKASCSEQRTAKLFFIQAILACVVRRERNQLQPKMHVRTNVHEQQMHSSSMHTFIVDSYVRRR